LKPELHGKSIRYKMIVPGVIDKSPNVLKFDIVVVWRGNLRFEMEVLEVFGDRVINSSRRIYIGDIGLVIFVAGCLKVAKSSVCHSHANI
jgi:hypothetical protein